jgi:hypothetical protein
VRLPRAKQNPSKTGKCFPLAGAALLTTFDFVAWVLLPPPPFLGVFPMLHKGVSLYLLSELRFVVKNALGKNDFLKTPSIFGPWDFFCPFGTVEVYRTSYWAELSIFESYFPPMVLYARAQLSVECKTWFCVLRNSVLTY